MSVVSNILLDWKIFLVGFGLLASVSLINAKIPILPVSCLTFIATSISLWFTSMCVTFVCLNKLLQKNEPLELHIVPKPTEDLPKSLKPDPDRVKILTADIDKYFISYWYKWISKDENFTDESKVFAEDVLSRLAEVQLCVSNKVLLHGILNIYLKHYKEFRRSMKRKEKYDGMVEDLYRYSHLCSNNSKRKDYFIHQLTTKLLHRFINSELWNSLPCHILVSILARKFSSYIINHYSDPEILNYTLLYLIASSEIREKYNLGAYSRISLCQYYDVKDASEKPKDKATEKVEDAQASDIVDSLSSEMKAAEYEPDTTSIKVKSERLKELKHRKRASRKKVGVAEEFKEPSTEKRFVSDPVTIYEPKSHRTVNTWTDPQDLTLGISLGQDPLAAMPVESVKPFGKSAFWETGKMDSSEDSPAHAANLLLNEMKQTTQNTMEGLKSSIKPISDATVNTLHNIKDLQESTMNNALNRIGDFQDEAAGMVEGILDFGRTKFRKGLRLTGLQDNIENAKAAAPNVASQPIKASTKKKPAKLVRSDSPERALFDEDSVWLNPLQIDSPNFDGQILLESNPIKLDKREKKELQIPFISMEQAEVGTDSPDPEYEDTADLASSIAKLRSLLQQRSSESSLSTPALSPIFIQAKYYGIKKTRAGSSLVNARPSDDFPPKPTEAESTSDVDEVDGVMPSFYKFCAKTATGVLDKTLSTIKTALPGNPQGVEQSDNAWIFIQVDQNEADIVTRMKKLLTERKEYCTLDTEIDTAYEAMDSLNTLRPSLSTNVAFEDELDAFEVKLPITKALVDILCELLADTDSSFIREPLVRAILLSLGNTLENFIVTKVDKLMENFCINLVMIPEKTNTNTLVLEVDAYVEAILSSLPDAVKMVFGKSTLQKAFTTFVSSMQIQKINEDVILQIFELLVMKLIEESYQLSPPASA